MNWESQIWPFHSVMAIGEPIVMPLKHRSAFAIGRITRPYEYQLHSGEGLHTRGVDWIREVPRDALAQDLRFSFGAFLTVFQVSRNNAESRVSVVLSGGSDPALGSRGTSAPAAKAPMDAPDSMDAEIGTFDLAQIAEDAIRAKIGTVFKGHKLSALVGAILETHGYRVVVSPPGADGGVDIIAGKGPLGIEGPRLVVQVKSQDSPVDVAVLRELQGVMRQFSAEQGLLVAWGGVTKALAREAQRHFFEIRIWDAGEVVRSLQQSYDQVSEALQSDLPLKRIWVLADQE
ncbi:MAG: restriction endonuclease [Alphaproteobacteria bacterium]|nr:MAG: restriction endonuclease [Alphaproteobacteria bacterium]